MPSANMVHIDSHAIATLRHIRNSMDAATSIAVPGSTGIAMGCVGLVATALSYAPRLQEYWIAVWLLAAVIAAGVGAVLLTRPAARRGLNLPGMHVRRFALCLVPSLFAGAVLTAVLCFSGQVSAVPGTWLLLYGCALMAVSVVTNSMVAAMGGMFVVLGLLAFFSPAILQVALLGVGFGGLHILFGILMRRAADEC